MTSLALPAHQSPLGRGPWLVFLSLLVHVLEEWPELPEWATNNFGTTSPGFFFVSHVPILGRRGATRAGGAGVLLTLLITASLALDMPSL